MSKKLITACMALVAIAAFVLPAVASASPVLTNGKGGAAVATGTKIQATNVGNTLLKDGEGKNTLTECTTAKMTGELTKNSGTLIEGNIETARFSGTGAAIGGVNECTGTFGNLRVTTNGGGVDGESVASGTPYCLKATGAADEFSLRGGNCSEASRKITFIFDTTFAGGTTECKYERTAAITGTFTTESTGDAILSVVAGANTKFTAEAGNNILCPAAGTLQMSFTLESDPAAGEATAYYIS